MIHQKAVKIEYSYLLQKNNVHKSYFNRNSPLLTFKKNLLEIKSKVKAILFPRVV